MKTTAIAGILAALLAVEAASGQIAPYRVVNGETDSDGFPTTPARICISSGNGDQCYSPPLPKAPLPPFGLSATAKDLKLATGAGLIVFTAESSSGGSGSLTSIALLENRNGRLFDLLPSVTVTNQSEYRFWNLPTVSAMPVLVIADFVWREGETHFSQHHYRITTYAYPGKAGLTRSRTSTSRRRSYPGLDESDRDQGVKEEKATIVRKTPKSLRILR